MISLYDNHLELKEAELMNERLSLLQTAEPYIGKYYSQDYVRRKILRQTDGEILEQDKLIEKKSRMVSFLILQLLSFNRTTICTRRWRW